MRRHQTTEPMRRCIGCMQSKPQSEMMRFTVCDSRIVADEARRNEGRGHYLCRDDECIRKSFKRKAWNRILKTGADTEEIMRAIDKALNAN
ncbi:MAG: YlxR family protein [Mogibacterium sp.]|nr:YlxR family protein [Mogibacterium sp.]